jgi:hypothetical protein
MSHDGRRAWAFMAIVGGCMVQTLHLFWITWLLQTHAQYLFYMAVGLIFLLFVGFTALGWQMGRRMQLEGTRDGFKINDNQQMDMHRETRIIQTIEENTAPVKVEELDL